MKGCSLVELRVTPVGSYTAVDAFGIPLRVAWAEELGVTYLGPREIEALARKAVKRQKYYNPLTNNCQQVWTDELLPKLVCQCPRQRLLEIPTQLLSFGDRIMILIAVASLVVAIISTLADCGLIPFPPRLCSKSSRWGFVVSELSKYFMAARTLQRIPSSFVTNTGIQIPYVDCDLVERLEAVRNGNFFHYFPLDEILQDDPRTLRIYTQFSAKVVWLFRFQILFTILSTPISFMYRFSPSYLFQALYVLSFVLVTFQLWQAVRLVGLPQFPIPRSCAAQFIKAELERERKTN